MAHHTNAADVEYDFQIKQEVVPEENDQLKETDINGQALWLAQGNEKESNTVKECFDRQKYRELYARHVVKEELVIGPEVLHRPGEVATSEDTNKGVECPRGFLSGAQAVENVEKDEIRGHKIFKLKSECHKAAIIESKDTENDGVYVKEDKNKDLEVSNFSLDTVQDTYISEIFESVEKNAISCEINRASHLSCSECEYQAVNSELLKIHLRLHDKSRLFVCHSCEHRFNDKQVLLNHINKSHSDAKYSCVLCKYDFSSKSALQTHLRVHSKQKIKIDYSSNKTKTLKMLTSDKPNTCKHCNYSCNNESTCKIHLRRHNAEKSHSEDHLRTHTGENSFICAYCNYVCNKKSRLKDHLRTHTGEKPYSCTFCKYSCSQIGSLNRHLRIHTGEKPFTCALCNYTCSTNSSLKKHLRTHTGEKPYSCRLCMYKCSRWEHLKQHFRTHSGEKPYSCTLCNYTCSTNSSLKKHLRNILVRSLILVDFVCTDIVDGSI